MIEETKFFKSIGFGDENLPDLVVRTGPYLVGIIFQFDCSNVRIELRPDEARQFAALLLEAAPIAEKMSDEQEAALAVYRKKS